MHHQSECLPSSVVLSREMGKVPYAPSEPTERGSRSGVLVCLALIGSGALSLYYHHFYEPVLYASRPALIYSQLPTDRYHAELCPQVPPLAPRKHHELVQELNAVYADDDYRLWAYENLGAAVRVP